jgi:hypothetical protein
MDISNCLIHMTELLKGHGSKCASHIIEQLFWNVKGFSEQVDGFLIGETHGPNPGPLAF